MHARKLEIPTKECNCASTRDPSRQELSKLTLSSLTLTETLHAPGSRIPPHTHDRASICLALTGQGVEIADGIRVNTQPGSVIIRGPRVIHSDQYGLVPKLAFMIELEEQWLK